MKADFERGMKWCPYHKAEHPIGDFTKARRYTDGLNPYCRAAGLERERAWRAKNPEMARQLKAASSRRYAQRHPDKIREKEKRRDPAARRSAGNAWRARNKERISTRRAWLNHRLSPEGFDELLAMQGGGCAICASKEPGGRGRWHVDHDHSCCPKNRTCGACIRGLLCTRCNVALGQFKDSVATLQAAVKYLTNPPAKRRPTA